MLWFVSIFFFHFPFPLLILRSSLTSHKGWLGVGVDNLVPRAFPSKNGWGATHFWEEKPGGTRLGGGGWV